MNAWTFTLAVIGLIIGAVIYAIYAMAEGSVGAAFGLGLMSGVVLCSIGQLFGLAQTWLNSILEERRFKNNFQENMHLMGATMRISNQQGAALARQNQQLIRSNLSLQSGQPEPQASLEDALYWDDDVLDGDSEELL